jgi:hypothetical protein
MRVLNYYQYLMEIKMKFINNFIINIVKTEEYHSNGQLIGEEKVVKTKFLVRNAYILLKIENLKN